LNGSLTPFSINDTVAINETQGPLSYNVVVTDANGCSAKSPNYVFNYIPGVSKPIITSTPSEKNCDGTLTLTSSSSTGNFWYNGATTQSITINKTERAWVRVESSNGCKNTSDTTWFEATEGTSIELTYKVSEFYNAQFNISEFGGKDGSIDITTTGGVSPITYAWTDSTGTFNFAGEDLNTLGEGTYFITVNDKYGCKVSDTIRLKAPFEFKLPSGISPNGDGNYDVFIIGSIEKFPNNKVRIYNRWGGIIFTVEGYNNLDKVWKGTNDNDEPLPEGTYYVVVTFPDGKSESLNKYVDLKR
jgi:gliding motility-associated-like protein